VLVVAGLAVVVVDDRFVVVVVCFLIEDVVVFVVVLADVADERVVSLVESVAGFVVESVEVLGILSYILIRFFSI